MALPVRDSHPDTSFEAAEKAALGSSAVRAVVLDIMRTRGPLTHDELIAEYQELVGDIEGTPRAASSGIRTRLHELVERGPVAEHPASDGVSNFGNRARLWCAVDANGVIVTGSGEDPRFVWGRRARDRAEVREPEPVA